MVPIGNFYFFFGIRLSMPEKIHGWDEGTEQFLEENWKESFSNVRSDAVPVNFGILKYHPMKWYIREILLVWHQFSQWSVSCQKCPGEQKNIFQAKIWERDLVSLCDDCCIRNKSRLINYLGQIIRERKLMTVSTFFISSDWVV